MIVPVQSAKAISTYFYRHPTVLFLTLAFLVVLVIPVALQITFTLPPWVLPVYRTGSFILCIVAIIYFHKHKVGIDGKKH